MVDVEKLVQRLNNIFQDKWTKSFFTLTLDKPKNIDDIVKQNFPIELWFIFTLKSRLCAPWIDRDDIPEKIEVKSGCYLVLWNYLTQNLKITHYPPITYTQFMVVSELFYRPWEVRSSVNNLEMTFTLPYEEIPRNFFERKYPPELIQMISVRDRKAIIPIDHIPVFYDYLSENFPLHYPVGKHLCEKIVDFLNAQSPIRWTYVTSPYNEVYHNYEKW